MKILIVNGSPKKDRSDTMCITNAFLEGMREADSAMECETIHAVSAEVKPCLGCYSCWWKTPGTCVHKDAMADILKQMTAADLVILSTPLYCYGFPAPLKAIIDRMLPLSTPVQETDEEGNTYHPAREDHEVRFLLISGCGFPDREGNYDGMIFEFQRMFGDNSPMLLTPEAPMMNIPDAKPLVEPYLALVKIAGTEYAKNGKIQPETMEALKKPMMEPDAYRKMCSQ